MEILDKEIEGDKFKSHKTDHKTWCIICLHQVSSYFYFEYFNPILIFLSQESTMTESLPKSRQFYQEDPFPCCHLIITQMAGHLEKTGRQVHMSFRCPSPKLMVKIILQCCRRHRCTALSFWKSGNLLNKYIQLAGPSQ